MPDRVYLDWNATAPLRPEARAAMIAAMDVVGNPSSVHTEGRAAKTIVEKAREQVAGLVGCDRDEVIFTSGATEAINTILRRNWDFIILPPTEHDAVWNAAEASPAKTKVLPVDSSGCVDLGVLQNLLSEFGGERTLVCVQSINSETGVLQPRGVKQLVDEYASYLLCDHTQMVGKAVDGLNRCLGDYPSHFAAISAHKFGGPKGVGALIASDANFGSPLVFGGGQESSKRAGTENVIAIAGFGAAASVVEPDVEGWVEADIDQFDYAAERASAYTLSLRRLLETAVLESDLSLIVMGSSSRRAFNTSCFAIPGWKGETQVMQLDLAGFAVSAGSACSSGKVGPSRVLKAMGFDDITASSAIRVSMGPTTTKDEVSRFIDAWTGLYQRMKTRAA